MPNDLERLVASHIGTFHKKRREKLRTLNARQLLKQKNPYLFAARRSSTARSLADEMVRAVVSSSEESLFGKTLEAIAVDICAAAFGGQKSAATGIDLEFTRDNIRYLVAIKSGEGWGNSRQVSRLQGDFRVAKQLIRESDRRVRIEAINGCCYGTVDRDYGDYRKVAGAAFWELVSGDPGLYAKVLAAVRAAATNGYTAERRRATRAIASELSQDWTVDGTHIDWQKIIEFNSKNL